jgi:Mrp family chromosome partitioning ATPase
MSNRTLEHVDASAHARLNSFVPPPRAAIARPELGGLLSVLFMQLDETPSMVLHVTSATPGEGTTTVARDIAVGAAAAGWCSVILIDARPVVAERRGGLVQSFERGEPLALRRSRIGGTQIDTAVLSTSGQPVSRLEILRSLYGALRRRYSLIVVDCPSVFAGQQMMVLASAADETILVLEAERSHLSEVARAREALDQRGASVMGVVMNKSRHRIPTMLGRLL